MASPSSTEGITFPTLFMRLDHTASIDPINTDSAEFACLASIARLGLVTLEGSRGREALENVGHYVLDQWQQTGRMDCDADPSKMGEYVADFLYRVRDGFPSIVVDSSLENPHTLPISSRVFTTEPCQGAWDGDRANFVPGAAMSIAINAARFNSMVALFRRFQSQRAGEADDQGAYFDFLTYQFVFGARVAHDLCHAFVVMLAGDQRASDFTYTRPKLDSRGVPRHALQEMLLGGEPGRHLQRTLYGGYLELYEDLRVHGAQPGIPFVVNRANLASMVSAEAITGQIWCAGEDGQFPLGTEGRGLSLDETLNDKIVKVVYDNHHSPTPRIRGITPATEQLMRELILRRGGTAFFRVAESDMCWVATQPGRLVGALRVR